VVNITGISNLKSASFSQNGQLSYSIEQFSSYDELKVAFGSNVDTRKLFNKQSTSENQYDHMISKRTGIYVKFYQTSFTLDMDIPNGSLVKNNNFDDGGFEPVYVSSISYGRMGVLAIETDEYSEEALKVINTTFSKIFKKGESNLTTEELKLINSADFKLLLLGGNANTSVQTFKGYEAFVQHITQGTFTKESPGIPIFCSYSYLNDNSPVKTKFKFDIKKPPLYIELVRENSIVYPELGSPGSRITQYRKSDFILKFYSSRSKMPVIASPYINIYLSKRLFTSGTGRGGYYYTIFQSKEIIKQNSLYQTSLTVEKQAKTYDINGLSLDEGGTKYNYNMEYVLLPDNKLNYIPITN